MIRGAVFVLYLLGAMTGAFAFDMLQNGQDVFAYSAITVSTIVCAIGAYLISEN